MRNVGVVSDMTGDGRMEIGVPGGSAAYIQHLRGRSKDILSVVRSLKWLLGAD